jgi:hypothetical protein
MANIELINLVTTELIQKKKISEYGIRNEVNNENGNPQTVLRKLREYNQTISDIQLWESLLDEITPIPEEKEKGDNNN